MKKRLNFISIFLLMITCVSAFVFSVSGGMKVAAADSPRTKDAMVIGSASDKNHVKLTKEGAITIQYEYGYSELLVVAQACRSLSYDKKGCNSFSNGNVIIIHSSGDYNLDAEVKTKTIHLFNYFDYDTIVSVGIYTTFMTESKNRDDSQYYPVFCNFDSGETCRKAIGTANKQEMLASHRVETIAKKIFGTSLQTDIRYTDRKNLIYGTEGTRSTLLSQGSEILIKEGTSGSQVDKLVIMVDNSKVKGASADVEGLIYDTIIPTLIAILIIAAGVTCAVQGYKIVKSSDEPQERQEKIKHLRNVLIGIAIALLLLFVLEPAATAVTELLEER